MRKFILNIGTIKGENHGSDKEQQSIGLQLQRVRNELARCELKGNVYTRQSEGGDWNSELVIVVEVDCRINHENDDFQDLWFIILDLLRTADQDAIAVEGINHTDGGYILFHPNYTGERYAFDSAYFVK